MCKEKINIFALVLICLIPCMFGCEKFLAEKSNKKLTVPHTLRDFQALLDDSNMLISSSAAGEVSSDTYYLSDSKWAGLTSESDRRLYTWEKDRLFSISASNDWNNAYLAIYSCNTVLKGLEQISESNSNLTELRNVKGQALFCRGNIFLDAAIVWCLAYDSQSSAVDLGLPLRLNTNFNERSSRSTLQETYSQILSDLKASVALLPIVPLTKNRPSKSAAYGLIARAYLAMRDYDNSMLYADSCLQLKNDILDLNEIVLTGNFPFTPANNKEVIYIHYLKATPLNSIFFPIVPTDLYESFVTGDLRKLAFFRSNTDGTYSFKGYYDANNGVFNGVATNEIYLMKAEGLARKGMFAESMDLLNALLIKRWDKSKSYVPQTATSQAEAVAKIVKERKKELIMRGLRWMDIKRLNKEGANISMDRIVQGTRYTLPANDLRFALPIPEDVIALSGMIQNYR